MSEPDAVLAAEVREDLFDRVLEDAELAVRDAHMHAARLGAGLFDPGRLELRSLYDALSDLERRNPCLADEIASLCDRVREFGMSAAASELSRSASVVHAIRLSLEIFTRTCFDPEALELVLRERGESGDVASLAQDLWVTKRRLLSALRHTLN